VDLLTRSNLTKEIQAFEILIKCCKFVPPLGGNMSFADFLESLTAFEAGGSELAFAPIDSFKEMPADASISGGQNAAIAWFRRSLESSEQAMLFLVGAPGNGKSICCAKLLRAWFQSVTTKKIAGDLNLKTIPKLVLLSLTMRLRRLRVVNQLVSLYPT